MDEGEERAGTAGDPLGVLVEFDCSRFFQTVGEGGVIRFRGREGNREVTGEYHPEAHYLSYNGWEEGGRHGIRAEQLRGETHRDFEGPMRGLHAWLDHQR